MHIFLTINQHEILIITLTFPFKTITRLLLFQYAKNRQPINTNPKPYNRNQTPVHFLNTENKSARSRNP